MSAKKYSILIIVTALTLIVVIKGFNFRTAKGDTEAGSQVQTSSGLLSRADQEFESASDREVVETGGLQEQLEEVEERADTGRNSEGRCGLLASILYSDRISSVVIDGLILHEGDMIHGVRVFKIHKDTVELEKSGEKWEQQVGMTFSLGTDQI